MSFAPPTKVGVFIFFHLNISFFPTFGVSITLMKKETSSDLPIISSTEECIEFSNRLLTAFETKARLHNEAGIRKVTVSKLKEIYLQAASTDTPLGKNIKGLAFINSYLSFLNCVDLKNRFLNMEGLEFEEQECGDHEKAFAKIDKDFCDLPEDEVTTEENLSAARKDLEDYDLNKSFESIDDLFIYTQNKPLEFNWEIR